jgi:hypothetical protein
MDEKAETREQRRESREERVEIKERRPDDASAPRRRGQETAGWRQPYPNPL